eukprot:scaffold40_cov305-Pinguiococcus_pyrenoidosus.AAC.13
MRRSSGCMTTSSTSCTSVPRKEASSSAPVAVGGGGLFSEVEVSTGGGTCWASRAEPSCASGALCSSFAICAWS